MVKISTNGEPQRTLIYPRYNGILLMTRAVLKTPGENPTLSAIQSAVRESFSRYESPAFQSVTKQGQEVEEAMFGNSEHRFLFWLVVAQGWHLPIRRVPLGAGLRPARSACVSSCRPWWPS